MGARGNSGIILSQFFRGLAKGFEGKLNFDGGDFAKALVGGLQTAYKGIVNLVEGTILTVLRLFNFALALDSDLSWLSQEFFTSKFCSCLIYQAHSPNKLGNYTFKPPLRLRCEGIPSFVLSKAKALTPLSRIFAF
jgi:hypothetical protein